VTHSAKVTGKPAGFNGAKARAVKLADKIANLRDVEVPPSRLASFNGCAMVLIARSSLVEQPHGLFDQKPQPRRGGLPRGQLVI
jgi:hypothetical protein